MYTILVCDSNDLYGSQKERIMQKEKLFNKIRFLVAPHYNGYDMSKCTVTMRYLLPISKEFKTETLEMLEEKYEGYLTYILPIDTGLSKEWGDVELNLTFTMLDIDDNGNLVQRVRKTGNHILHITELPNWDAVIPDQALSALDQRILKQDAQIKALRDLAITIDYNKADNLVYDSKKETLQLYANGVGIGNKVSVRNMLDDGTPVIDLDSNSGNDSDEDAPSVDDNNGCDCGCEDNVVEIGYSQNGATKPEWPNEDEENVVTF